VIFAELRGKLGADASRAHARLEDLLTSTVFGLLRYFPPQEGLLALLRRARPVRSDQGGFRVQAEDDWLHLRGIARCTVEFWPSLGRHGEPDLLLHLVDEKDRQLGLVLIETKLYSPKGMRDEVDEDLDDERPDPDQLVRYWHGLKQLSAKRADIPVSLVYLTSRTTPPTAELEASLTRAPDMRLGWLSWHDAWRVAAALAESSGHLAAVDLAALLAHKGLSAFDGFSDIEPSSFPPPTRYWMDGGWFNPVSLQPNDVTLDAWEPASPLFWEKS
jgi:hypothetical protein